VNSDDNDDDDEDENVEEQEEAENQGVLQLLPAIWRNRQHL